MKNIMKEGISMKTLCSGKLILFILLLLSVFLTGCNKETEQEKLVRELKEKIEVYQKQSIEKDKQETTEKETEKNPVIIEKGILDKLGYDFKIDPSRDLSKDIRILEYNQIAYILDYYLFKDIDKFLFISTNIEQYKYINDIIPASKHTKDLEDLSYMVELLDGSDYYKNDEYYNNIKAKYPGYKDYILNIYKEDQISISRLNKAEVVINKYSK